MRHFGRLVTAGTVLFVLGLALFVGERPRFGIALALTLGAATAAAPAIGRMATRTRPRRIALCGITALLHLALGLHTLVWPISPETRWLGLLLLAVAAFWAVLTFRVSSLPPGPTKGRVQDDQAFEL